MTKKPISTLVSVLTQGVAVFKAAVVGLVERNSRRVRARPIAGTHTAQLQGAVRSAVAQQWTSELPSTQTGMSAYQGMKEYRQTAVLHSSGEYVWGMAHTNGIESFWALRTRGYYGTCHHFSDKHMQRYVDEFSTRHNRRDRSTPEQIHHSIISTHGKLGYSNLTAWALD